jgi:hypothetical protein
MRLIYEYHENICVKTGQEWAKWEWSKISLQSILKNLLFAEMRKL